MELLWVFIPNCVYTSWIFIPLYITNISFDDEIRTRKDENVY